MSYSCTKNIKTVINNHNKNTLNNPIVATKTCNCISKPKCPLNNNCLIENTVYQATISSNENTQSKKVYIGIAETTFKKRYANHLKSFNTKKYENDTELSKEVWKIKQKNQTPIITWKVLKQCPPFNTINNKCQLCLNEKLSIIEYREKNLLNKKNELISKCRHQNKYTLVKHDSKY